MARAEQTRLDLWVRSLVLEDLCHFSICLGNIDEVWNKNQTGRRLDKVRPGQTNQTRFDVGTEVRTCDQFWRLTPVLAPIQGPKGYPLRLLAPALALAMSTTIPYF